MKPLNKKSLAETVDAVNEVLFFGKKLEKQQKNEIAGWIASRQGLEKSYCNMFAPTEADFETGIRVFTGESINTRAGISHILSEESSRLLLKLGKKNKTVENALEKSTQGFEKAMKRAVGMGHYEGVYCCGKCTVAYWRNLAAGGLTKQKKRLRLGMKLLSSQRDGKGRWRSMPFYYTLLALSEIDLPLTKKELEYAAPGLVKLLKRMRDKNKYDMRRRLLIERVLKLV